MQTRWTSTISLLTVLSRHNQQALSTIHNTLCISCMFSSPDTIEKLQRYHISSCIHFTGMWTRHHATHRFIYYFITRRHNNLCHYCFTCCTRRHSISVLLQLLKSDHCTEHLMDVLNEVSFYTQTHTHMHVRICVCVHRRHIIIEK